MAINNNYSFRRTQPLRFRQSDLAGVAYFNEVFNLFHDVYEDFVEDQLCTKNEWFQNKIWAVPLKKVEAEYTKPLLPFKSYEIAICVQSVGTSSFSIQTHILHDEQVCVELTTVHVFIDIKKQVALPIPPLIQQKLQALVRKG